MIHYTQVTCLGTIKNSPTTIVCDLDRGVQLTQVINLPRSPLQHLARMECDMSNMLHLMLIASYNSHLCLPTKNAYHGD